MAVVDIDTENSRPEFGIFPSPCQLLVFIHWGEKNEKHVSGQALDACKATWASLFYWPVTIQYLHSVLIKDTAK